MAGDSNSKLSIAFLTVLLLGVAGWYVTKWWTRPPVVEFNNLKYVQLLMTVVSSKDQEKLGRLEDSINNQFKEGEMSDREHKSFQTIIAQARSGKWDEAQKASFRLAEGQLRRARSQSPSEHSHSHDHDHKHDREHGHTHDKPVKK